MTNFALIHSPLVGPSTWKPVAAKLERLGHAVTIPVLKDSDQASLPYWQQNAESAARAVRSAFPDESCILVGHSGAGPLLPAIVDRLAKPPAGLIYVDAGLPANGNSRLELMRSESSEFADELETSLRAGAQFPDWSDADLREVILDDVLRAQTIAELRSRSLAFFSERITFSDAWESLPQGYLQFSPAYEVYAETAIARGWPFMYIPAGHFFMLIDPAATIEALIKLACQILPDSI